MHALKEAKGHTLECATCGAFVDLQTARKLARKAGRDVIAPGDGCAARSCVRKFDKKRFREVQEKMSRALLAGTRTLVITPDSVQSRIELTLRSSEYTAAAVLRSS